jgi:hypothetical protein
MINVAKRRDGGACEFLLPFYYWGFVFLKPVLQQCREYSTVILFGFALSIMAMFVFYVLRERQFFFNGAVLFIINVTVVLFFDVVARNNSLSGRYFYEFVYSSLIPVLLLSQIKDTRKFLYNFSILSTIAFILFCFDPINNYKILGNYMGFGFNVAMPAFFGIYLGAHYFKIKWMLVLEIVCFVEILVFANRSSFLSIILFMALMNTVVNKVNFRQMAKWLLCVMIIFILAVNIHPIFHAIRGIVSKFGIFSYSLTRIEQYLNAPDVSILLTGRSEIWEVSRQMISESPFVGHGMGALEDRWGFYSHNVYYEILLSYGYLGLTIILMLFLNSVGKVISFKGSNKIFAILFFCIWCPKLFFSIYFIREPAFWCFIALSFMSKQLKCNDADTISSFA